MAKKIRLSDDNGTTWYDLPGSEGSFTAEAEGIDDTILGQTYQSNEVGLIGWMVSANGIYKGFAGYLAELKTIGTSTAMTGESMTLVSGKTYAIDDAAKEMWDRSTALTIDDNASPVAAADIESVDYLFGRVTFVDSYTPTGSITVDGNYYPSTTFARAKSYTLTMSAEAIDETDFQTAQANSGHRIFSSGLRTVSVELSGIWDITENAKADLIARNEIIIEVDPAGDGSSVARGFFKITNTGQSGAVGALEEETITASLTVPIEETNPSVELPFNWRHTNTALSQAVQVAIASWLGELNTYDVQYLPTGVTGATPNDGIQGNFVATDISLSSGLSAMNVFNVELQGTGAYTEV